MFFRLSLVREFLKYYIIGNARLKHYQGVSHKLKTLLQASCGHHTTPEIAQAHNDAKVCTECSGAVQNATSSSGVCRTDSKSNFCC